MNQRFVAKADVRINASRTSVWEALTRPELVKEYLFGTQVSTDWKVGSPITYKGVWQGKAYEDKGTILELVPRKRLKTTYWSSMSARPDTAENYNTIVYELSDGGEETTLLISQDNNPTKESADHSEGNWRSVLQTMKTLLES